ncbi:MAG: hypothetical protein AAF533_19725 [Acidobacteriota bacterium]
MLPVVRDRSLPVLLIVVGLLLPTPAQAGMPVWLLSEMATVRLEVISFFLVTFLLASKGVQLLWNSLRKDFTSLPLLSYRRALAFVLLWGLAFNLILTMISGARELMTPGAWVKDGVTYKLSSEKDGGEHPETDAE